MPRLAVLGRPVAHSRSPAMQNAALAELGLAGEWSYEAIEVEPDALAAQLRDMAGGDFAGANVTLPHKAAALALADQASATARAIGVANTLSFDGGRIAAENTDAAGFLAALAGPPAGCSALVLGAGGSARAVVWALAEAGAEVAVWNRTPERANELAAGFGARSVGEDDLAVAAFELVVNCTTAGMPGGPGLDALPIDAAAIGPATTLVDLAYGCAATELVTAARSRGATVVDGLEVLVRQGAASLRIWTGREPPLEVMRRAARG